MQEGYENRLSERVKTVGAYQEKMVLWYLATLPSHPFLCTYG